MISRKKLLIVVGILVLLGVFVAIAIRRDNSTNQPTNSIQEPDSNEAWTVTITNIDQYKEVSSEQYSSLTKGLYTFLKKNVPTAGIAYTGNIREGSYVKSLTPAQDPNIEFLVDIPKVERTYKVTIEGSEESEYQTIYVTCPTASELVYKPSSCNDEQ